MSVYYYTAQLDIDDAMTAGSRTPFNTPPERRRENVFELGDILEALQSVGRRNSQPVRILTSMALPMSNFVGNFYELLDLDVYVCVLWGWGWGWGEEPTTSGY